MSELDHLSDAETVERATDDPRSWVRSHVDFVVGTKLPIGWRSQRIAIVRYLNWLLANGAKARFHDVAQTWLTRATAAQGPEGVDALDARVWLNRHQRNGSEDPRPLVAVTTRVLGADHPVTSAAWMNVARWSLARKDPQLLVESLRHVTEAYVARGESATMASLRAHEAYGAGLAAVGESAQAIDVRRDVVTRLRSLYVPNPKFLAEAIVGLIEVLLRADRVDEALAEIASLDVDGDVTLAPRERTKLQLIHGVTRGVDQQFEQAIALLEPLDVWSAPVGAYWQSTSMVVLVRAFVACERDEELLALVARGIASTLPTSPAMRTALLGCKMNTLFRLGRVDEAASVCGELIEVLHEPTTKPRIQARLASQALVVLAVKGRTNDFPDIAARALTQWRQLAPFAALDDDVIIATLATLQPGDGERMAQRREWLQALAMMDLDQINDPLQRALVRGGLA